MEDITIWTLDHLRDSQLVEFLWTHHWDILSKPPKGSFVCLCTWSHGTSIVAWWCLRDVRLGKPTLDHRATVRPEELAGMWDEDERFAGTCAKDFCRSMLSISHQQLCQNPEFYSGTKLQSSIFLLANKIWSLDAFSLFRSCLWIMNPKVKSFPATISNLWGCGRFIISGPWVQWSGFCKWDGMDPRAGHVLKFSFVGTWLSPFHSFVKRPNAVGTIHENKFMGILTWVRLAFVNIFGGS